MVSIADLTSLGSNILQVSQRFEHSQNSDITNAYSVNNNIFLGYAFKNSNMLLVDNGPYAKSLLNYGGIYDVNSNMNSLLLSSGNFATFAEDNWLLNSNITISGWFKGSGFADGDEIIDFTYQKIDHPNVSPYTPAIQINKNEYYVAFTTVGTNSISFTKDTKCDILVIGGGGGGGGDMGGGGGAGGVVYQKGVTLSSGTYTITVGAGGAARAASAVNTRNSVNGNDGSASSISIAGGSTLSINGITYQANGGGGGGNFNNNTSTNGNTGGSGGGGTNKNDDSTTTGGAATQGNTIYNLNSATNLAGGYAGSDGQRGNGWIAGGGGGAGGTSGSVNGGVGVQIDITGQSLWYAAGGGGGVIGDSSTSSIGSISGGKGGSGIGGNGNYVRFSDNFTNNYVQDSKHDGTNGTGSGGGGGVYNYGSTLRLNNGGAGGSGIVIIRYTVDTSYNSSFFNNTSNLEAWYKFDDNSTNMLLDSSGKSRNLTNNGATYDSNNYRTGNGSVSFTGSSYLQVTNDGRFSPDNFTISCWCKIVQPTANTYVAIASCRTSTNPSGWIIYVYNNNLQFWTGTGSIWSGGSVDLFSNFATNPTVWRHLVITMNKSTSTAIIYVNGVLITTVSRTYINNTGTNLRIGAGTNETTAQFFIPNGSLLDDFRIYNKVLSADEINTLYNIGYNIVIKRLNNNLSFELNNTSVYNTPYIDNTWNKFIWNIENTGTQGYVILNNGSKNLYNKVSLQSPLIRNYPVASLGSASGTGTDSSIVLSTQTHGNGLYRITASSSYSASYGGKLAFNKQSPSGEEYWSSDATYSTTTTLYTGTVSTTYNTNLTYLGEWLQIQLPQNIVLTSYTLVGQVNTSVAGIAGRSPKNFIILGSLNGIDWTLVDTETNITGWANLGAIRTFTINNTNAFSYYRICINANQGDATYGTMVSIAEWELFGYNAYTYVYNNMLGSATNKGSLYLADVKVLTNTYSDTIISNVTYGIAPDSYHVNYQFKNQSSLLLDDSVYNRTLTNSGGIYALNDSRNSIYLTSNTEALFENQNWSSNIDLTLSTWFKTNLFQNEDKIIDFNVDYNYAFFLETKDMIAWYKFDDNYNDSSGNNRTLTETGTFSYSTDAKVGTKSINQPNTNSSSYLANPNVNICTSVSDQAFSIAFWINFAAFGTLTYRVIGFGNEQINYKSLHIGLVNTGFRFSFWGVLFEQGYSSTDLLNKWVHFVCTYSNRTQKIYKDGVFVKQLAINTDPIFNTGYFRIGYSATGGNPSFIGNLDDVRIYNREITNSEINVLYTWNTNYIHNIVIKNYNNKLSLQVNDTSIYDTSFVQNRWYYLAWNLSSTSSPLGYVQLNDKKIATNKAILTNSYSPYLYTNKLGSSTNKGNLYLSDLKILTVPLSTSIEQSLYSNDIVVKNNNMLIHANQINYYNPSSKINSYLHYKFQSPALLTIDSSLNNRIFNNNGGIYNVDYGKNNLLLKTGCDVTLPTADWSTFSDFTISGWFKTNNLQNGDELLDFYQDPSTFIQIEQYVKYPKEAMTSDTFTSSTTGIVTRCKSTTIDSASYSVYTLFNNNYIDNTTESRMFHSGMVYNTTTGTTTNTYFTGYAGESVLIDLGVNIVLKQVRFYPRNNILERCPGVFRIYATNDTTKFDNLNYLGWVLIHDQTASNKLTTTNYVYGQPTIVNINNNNSYRVYALVVNTLSGTGAAANYLNFFEWELYGKEVTLTTTPITPVQISGGDYYYAFTNTNIVYNMSVLQDTVCDILIIGGGGSGGCRHGGGGGAGACIYLTNQTITSGTYTCKVGAGGPSISSGGVVGIDGEPSYIRYSSGTDIYLARGGGGGGIDPSPGRSGGSSGGCCTSTTAAARISGAVLTTNIPTGAYGNLGGNSSAITPSGEASYAGGGGGGYSSAGGNVTINGTNASGGAGGNGVSISITGTVVVYAGGGGGGCSSTTTGTAGAGGTGGGGAGSKGAVSATSGQTNTGSGGGGGGLNGSSNGASGAGGSGIVIIRYYIPNIVIKKVYNDLLFKINNTPIYTTPSTNNTWTHILWNISSSSSSQGFVRLSTTSIGTENTYTEVIPSSGTYVNKLGSITNVGSVNISDFRIITEPLTFEIKNRLYLSEPTYSSFVDTGYVNNVCKNVDSLYYNSSKKVEANANGITVYGNLTATNDIVASYSDMRLKQIISSIDNPLEKIMQINTFKYLPNALARSLNINDNKVRIGLSAQDVQKVLPEIVSLAPFDTSNLESGDIISASSSNYLSVSYERVVPLLIECLKEIKRELNMCK